MRNGFIGIQLGGGWDVGVDDALSCLEEQAGAGLPTSGLKGVGSDEESPSTNAAYPRAEQEGADDGNVDGKGQHNGVNEGRPSRAFGTKRGTAGKGCYRANRAEVALWTWHHAGGIRAVVALRARQWFKGA